MDEKEPLPYNDTNINYDEMTDEEYYKEMEKKVNFYKENYPDMYKKAEDWLKMLDHSEVYRKAQQEQQPNEQYESSAKIQAYDILKNMLSYGLTDDDITEKDKTILQEHIPNWKEQIEQNTKND
jgi:hypothetical protein